MTRLNEVFAFLAALGTPVTACHLAQLPVPDELATAAPLRVSGFPGREALTFGAWSTSRVNRSMITDSLSGNPASRVTETAYHDRYTFQLNEGAAARWQVSCTTAAGVTVDPDPHAIVDQIPGPLTLTCTLDPSSAEDRPLTIAASTQHDTPLRGTVTGGGETVQIVGTSSLAGTPMQLMTASGYYLRRNKLAIGAVSLLNGGAVFMAPDLSHADSSLVAAAASTLLLFQDLTTLMEHRP